MALFPGRVCGVGGRLGVAPVDVVVIGPDAPDRRHPG
ncbi:hypothetical protein QFZ23_002929 [Arthrobacter globiformis]|nr:hypothetical protein [Arthrobacter globiformis]